jgi:outer membrane receptor protein involved in Fe transport
VSHNYIGGFLETVNGTIPGADQFWKGRHSYDAQASWRFNDRYTLFTEVENLSNSGRVEVTGPNRDLLQEAAEYGRVYWLGATANF